MQAALGGLLIGGALRRGKRETLAEVFLEASRKDQYDCAKLLICELNAKSIEELKVISKLLNPFLLLTTYSQKNYILQCAYVVKYSVYINF